MFDVRDDFFSGLPPDAQQDNPWLTGPWKPQTKEFTVTGEDLVVIGEIPEDLDGLYLRNTHNQIQAPHAIYHPYDGDGMIHALRFRRGKVEYRNRFVRTTGFYAEQAAQRSLWPGILNPKDYGRRGWGAMGSMKDNAGTDVMVHAGKILATMSQGSEPWRLDPETLENLGPDAAWARHVRQVASHYKVDVETGDMIFFNYSEKAPYLHYGVVNADDELVHYVPIDLPGARWPHDIGLTKHYSVLHDLPYVWDPELLKQGIHKGHFDADLPARFGVIPRFGTSDEVRWFEAEPCWVMHITNCYEDGDWVVQDGCRRERLVKPPIDSSASEDEVYAKIKRNVDITKSAPVMWRWMFNMVTGEVREHALDDEVTEFPVLSNEYTGRPYRYSYNAFFEPGEWLITGLKKYDVQEGRSERLEFGPGRYGSEAGIARAVGSSIEDDGYVITFITDMTTDTSECVVYRADDLAGGAVCRIILPERISVGTHAAWVEGDRMTGERVRA